MNRFLFLLILISSVVAHAEDTLWKDNKLTPTQPFPGRVLAVETGWGGYRLFIESLGESNKTYCIAFVVPYVTHPVNYKIIQKDDLPKPSAVTVYLNPAIEIDRFSWSIGPWKIGSVFGDEDLLKVATTKPIPKNQ